MPSACQGGGIQTGVFSHWAVFAERGRDTFQLENTILSQYSFKLGQNMVVYKIKHPSFTGSGRKVISSEEERKK